ncbi:STAS domain-containing protein [Micromonospora pattaloongensis]|uniref:STAS domain-containing protein n=1 Tax=Micromonospora pattaloongensis TaxID=405436 RepID=UPI0015879067|nr:STAS domain-containing protein [Micromonospora pattaloongensis]
MGTEMWHGDPAPPVLVIGAAIGRADIPALCARLAELVVPLPAQGAVVVCDVSAVVEPSAVILDVLARLRLTARRLGADIRVHAAHANLCQLLALTGLGAVTPLGSALQPHWQAEEREQPLDVEEGGDRADPLG